MLKMKELDSKISFQQQLKDEDVEPVVLMILFGVGTNDSDAFKAAWATDAAFTKVQPGFISAQLHEAISGDNLFLDYAVFENVAAIAAMTRLPQFAALREIYPDSAVASLHLFRRVAIPGICLGEPKATDKTTGT